MGKHPEPYEITGEYADAYSVLMDCETDEEYEAALAALFAAEKAVGDMGEVMARILKNLSVKAEMQTLSAKLCKKEAERLAAKANATESAMRHIREKIRFALDTAGLERIRTPIGTWFKSRSAKVVVLDESEVADEFKIEQPAKVSTALIKSHWDATGEIPDGCDVIITDSAQFR